MRTMKNMLLALVSIPLTTLSLLTPASAQPAPSSDALKENQVLAKAKEVFGEPMKWDAHVFSVGEGFGVRFWFDESRRLFRADVTSIRYLENSSSDEEYSHPKLTDSDFEGLVATVAEVAPIGRKEWDGTVGLQGSGVTRWTNKYNMAYVEFVEGNEGSITSFRLLYILPWAGKVTWKHESQSDSGNHYDVISVGSENYLVSPEESARIVVGKRFTFFGARDSVLSYDKRGRHKVQ